MSLAFRSLKVWALVLSAALWVFALFLAVRSSSAYSGLIIGALAVVASVVSTNAARREGQNEVS